MNRRNFIKRLGLATAMTVAGSLKPERAFGDNEKRVWRMVTTWPRKLPIFQTNLEQFSENVAIMSDGRLEIKVYAAGELEKPLEVFDAVSEGRVECGHGAPYYWAKKVPAAQWFATVPFGFKASQLNTWLFKGGGLELWREAYSPYNVIPIPAGNSGIQMGGWFNKSIMTSADFNGLKIRMPGLGGRVLEKLGAKVVLLPAGEINNAMASGQINATEWVGPYHDMQMGFHRIAKFYYAPGWHEPGTGMEFTVNKEVYEALPSDLKLIIDIAALKLGSEMFFEFEFYNAQAMKEIVQEKKVQLRLFPQEVLRDLERISAEVLEEEASRDAMSRKVHDAYVLFKRDMDNYDLMKGAVRI